MLEIFGHSSLNPLTYQNGHTYSHFPGLMLSICIHVTGSKESVEEYVPAPKTPWTRSVPSSVPVSVQYGKPCFQTMLENEKAQQIGALAVSVCGPGSLGDSVRQATRNVQGEKTVDLFEEAFSW